jgi:hypothetical protein
MHTQSKSKIRWLLFGSFAYAGVCWFVLLPRVPSRYLCNAQDLFLASLLILVIILQILTGVTRFGIKNKEHPVSFAIIVATYSALALLCTLAGLGVFRPGCLK